MFNAIKNFVTTYIVTPIIETVKAVFNSVASLPRRIAADPFGTVCSTIVIACGFTLGAEVGLITLGATALTAIITDLLNLNPVAKLVCQWSLLIGTFAFTAPSIIIPLCGASIGCAL